jgi:RNA polymerase sigma-70 factor (ECF subfamily)
LRLSFVDRLTVDDLGELYGVHRATAARWLQRACEELSSRMRAIIRGESRMTDADYERWTGDVTRSLDLSLARYLSSTSE